MKMSLRMKRKNMRKRAVIVGIIKRDRRLNRKLCSKEEWKMTYEMQFELTKLSLNFIYPDVRVLLSHTLC
jgi:hypothetical protein